MVKNQTTYIHWILIEFILRPPVLLAIQVLVEKKPSIETITYITYLLVINTVHQRQKTNTGTRHLQEKRYTLYHHHAKSTSIVRNKYAQLKNKQRSAGLEADTLKRCKTQSNCYLNAHIFLLSYFGLSNVGKSLFPAIKNLRYAPIFD